MNYEDWRRTPLVPFRVLAALDRAGLGDVPQGCITREQYERAMRGEVVRILKPRNHRGNRGIQGTS